MNSIMERWIGSRRREQLDRTLIWNHRHPMSVLREYEDFYNMRRSRLTAPLPGRAEHERSSENTTPFRNIKDFYPERTVPPASGRDLP